MGELACTKAFTDEKGNRFVYPSMIRWPQDDEEDRPSKSDIILQAMTLDLALRTMADKDWFEFDPERFPHVRITVLHSGFAHGGATALLFAGPQFDEMTAPPAETDPSGPQGTEAALSAPDEPLPPSGVRDETDTLSRGSET